MIRITHQIHWHTDVTFKNDPPFASVLYSKTIPEVGGDTLYKKYMMHFYEFKALK